MIWSLTPFFNELDILEIRLATLDPVVDVHVLAEAPVTHTGLPKPLCFQENRERFKKWLPKIRHIVVDDMPDFPGSSNWDREKHQRRALLRGLDTLDTADLFLLSDVDEIPHPNALRVAEPPEHLRCHMHAGRLNWRWPGDPEEGFTISRVFTGKTIVENAYDLEAVRLLPLASRPSTPCGWHLSYMSGVEAKLAAFAHQEMVRDATPERIKGLIENGTDLFGRGHRWCEWTDELPPYVLENPERFSHLLIPKP